MAKKNPSEKITFTVGDIPEQPTTPPEQPTAAEGVTFTLEQFAALVDTLGLGEQATADEVIAAVTTLAENINKTKDELASEIAASAVLPQSIKVDAHVWRDMKLAIQKGLTLDHQEHRLAAEQVVDQAIRASKATPAAREQWIAAYIRDPEDTLMRLNRAKEIPRIEIGHGRESMPDERGGWVR